MADAADPMLTAAQRERIEARTHPAYRADIDGLRAVAVVPVVLYHAGVRGFSGGFVGVDIFFVISGFLITGILVRDVAIGRHSILEFYRRRILRIFPALIAVMVATTIGAWYFLLPSEMGRYATSLGAAAVFVSNVQFYLSTDYFNLGALSQPLLHTWSLAVEEQWYVLWPLIIAAIGPRRPRSMLGLTIALTVGSLLFSLWLLPRDPAATFYLLPTRAWELGLGALLAIAAPPQLPRWARESLGLVGLALIAFAVKTYTHDTPFPGLAAVPPCLGATLLLMTGRDNTLVARALSIAPLRFIGLISYSMYLWHWPILVFAATGVFLTKGFGATVMLLLIILAVSTLSWRFVERPFRSGLSGWRTSRVLAGGGAAIAAMVALAVATPMIARTLVPYTQTERRIAGFLNYDGDAAYRRDTCFKVGARGHYDPRACLTASGKRPVILLVGDSHAADLWPGLAPYRDRFDILQATATGCTARLYPVDTTNGCERIVNLALRDYIRRSPPAALILSSRWIARWSGGLEATLRDPVVRAAHPVLIGPNPEYSTGLPRLLVDASRRGDPALVQRALMPDPFVQDRALRRIAARTGTPYISLVDLLCRKQVCTTFAGPATPLLWDDHHFSGAGSRVVVEAMMPRIVAAMATPR